MCPGPLLLLGIGSCPAETVLAGGSFRAGRAGGTLGGLVGWYTRKVKMVENTLRNDFLKKSSHPLEDRGSGHVSTQVVAKNDIVPL